MKVNMPDTQLRRLSLALSEWPRQWVMPGTCAHLQKSNSPQPDSIADTVMPLLQCTVYQHHYKQLYSSKVSPWVMPKMVCSHPRAGYVHGI